MSAFLHFAVIPRLPRPASTPGAFSPPACKLHPSSLRLYLITDHCTHNNAPLLDVVRHALVPRPGVTILQLRDKKGSYADKLKLGHQLRRVTHEAGIPLIVNDEPHLAVAIQADGVHLGQDDVSPRVARDMLGEGAVIGMSAGNVSEAEIALRYDLDYIGTGPVFGTRTKKDAGDAIGVEGLRKVAEFVDGRVPIVAIGGVGVREVRRCVEVEGVEGVAVVGAVMASERAAEVVREMATEMQLPSW